MANRRAAELNYHGSNVIYFIPSPDMMMPNEEFRPIPQELIPGVMDYYMISNYGRLWHKFNRTFFSYLTDTTGHLYRVFKTEYGDVVYRIHTLVKRTFDPRPDNPNATIIFRDGNKSNILLWNLEYSTDCKDYNIDMTQNSYTDDIIHEICRRLETRDCTLTVISEELDVPYTLVQSINGGYTRRDISSQYNIETRKIPQVLTEQEIYKVCEFLQLHKNDIPVKIDRCRAAAEYIGKSSLDRFVVKAIKKILGRETFVHISSQFNI